MKANARNKTLVGQSFSYKFMTMNYEITSDDFIAVIIFVYIFTFYTLLQ